ncbi:hypothetical protein AVT69_gp015 [Pseudomonas phage PhiPA3]|uniref:Uncharacterized protein 015 n=1 Tax=Pseudomonas phage PhiPA3 TaxID=998086 RepID=F8SJP6_BPPA3|nr:hypothetical protein AVT69_gp015 [Pseudomonas phage PhiPA3]AEH03441.1 hypothetical protein [Pseudomonas phage PhiPA3]
MAISKAQLQEMITELDNGLRTNPDMFNMVADEPPFYIDDGRSVNQLGNNLFFTSGMHTTANIMVMTRINDEGRRFVHGINVVNMHNNIVYSLAMEEPDETDHITFDQMIELVRGLYNLPKKNKENDDA